MKKSHDTAKLNSIYILDVAQTLGLSVKDNKTLCFLHIEKTPSLSFNLKANKWHCFGCGKGGDVISLVMQKEQLGFIEACRWLEEKFSDTNTYNQLYFPRRKKSIPKKIQNPKSCIEVDYNLYTEVVAYLSLSKKAESYLSTARALSPHIIKSNHIVSIENIGEFYDWLRKSFESERLVNSGLLKRNEKKEICKQWWKPGIVFPYYDITGGIVNLQMRPYDTSKRFKYIFLNGVNTCMYNERILADLPCGTLVLLCEGAIDTLSLLTKNYKAVGLPGVGNIRDEWIDKLSYYNVHIIFDNDSAGRDNAIKCERTLRTRGINVERKCINNKYKDVNEMLVAEIKDKVNV